MSTAPERGCCAGARGVSTARRPPDKVGRTPRSARDPVVALFLASDRGLPLIT